MTNPSFRIQWHDTNNDEDGSFRGRSQQDDQWDQLISLYVDSSTTYDFYLSLADEVSYAAFLTLQTSSGTSSVGARIPNGYYDTGNNDAVVLSGIAIGQDNVTVHACKLISDDPKIQVTWGKTSQAAQVEVIWKGADDGWFWRTGDNEVPLGDNSVLEVDSSNQVGITVSDESSTKRIAAVYEDAGDDTGAIDGVQDLDDINSYLFTENQGDSNAPTTYTVNLFKRIGIGELRVD